MKFLKGLSSKKKDRAGPSFTGDYYEERNNFERSNFQYQPRTAGYDLTAKLPAPLLEKIFAFVCPHAQDATYESCEQSAVDDACMLCDLRDLSHCTRVSRRWRILAANVLYHSIRIDAVHYCEREEILAEKRKRRSFFDRNAEPEDPAQQRLRLLCRTLRDDNTGLGFTVRFFKISYMTRETCKADLARTVAVLPNLRYVDLPAGFFTDDPSCHTLKQELQGRCPDIRKMTYMNGAEISLESLATGLVWQNLEVLELSGLGTDPPTIRLVLGALPNLHALKITGMEFLDDSFFQMNPGLPAFPPVTHLQLEETPLITSLGLLTYLSASTTFQSLRTLSLNATGVLPSSLFEILHRASSLYKLSIIEQVTSRFPSTANSVLLVSASLRILHYEITSATSGNNYNNPASSYYAYLTSSLLANGLPALRQLYVRDPDFPSSLLDFVPPRPQFAASASIPNRPTSSSSSNYGSPPSSVYSTPSLGSNNPFASRAPARGLVYELEVYTKGLEEMEWNFARVEPASQDGRRGSMSEMRPVSMHGLSSGGAQMGPSWTGMGTGEVRKSVVVGNGFGGFLAVPVEEVGRHTRSSSASLNRSSKYDIWR